MERKGEGESQKNIFGFGECIYENIMVLLFRRRNTSTKQTNKMEKCPWVPQRSSSSFHPGTQSQACSERQRQVTLPVGMCIRVLCVNYMGRSAQVVNA